MEGEVRKRREGREGKKMRSRKGIGVWRKGWKGRGKEVRRKEERSLGARAEMPATNQVRHIIHGMLS